MAFALDNRVPFIIFLGDDEIKENKIKLKILANQTEVILSRDSYIEELLKLKQDPTLLIVKSEQKDGKNKTNK